MRVERLKALKSRGPYSPTEADEFPALFELVSLLLPQDEWFMDSSAKGNARVISHARDGKMKACARLFGCTSLLLIGLLSLLPPHPFAASTKAQLSQATTPPVSVVQDGDAPARESDRITQANWQNHPKIKAVRSLVAAVNVSLRRGALKTSVRKFEYCAPYADTVRKMAVDSKGAVRRFEKQAGSEDSALTWEHYYDEAGHLRFVFISGGAVNGAQMEHRIYFSESGGRLWEDHRYVKGPEYSFPKVWPDEQLQRSNPAKAFAAASPCPEEKAGR